MLIGANKKKVVEAGLADESGLVDEFVMLADALEGLNRRGSLM
jgi:hypothetical protein